MSRARWNDEPDDAWGEHPLDDLEGPQRCDLDSEEDGDECEVVSCPRCGREISELAERCPHCGDWISPGGRSPVKLASIVIALLLLALLLLWAF